MQTNPLPAVAVAFAVGVVTADVLALSALAVAPAAALAVAAAASGVRGPARGAGAALFFAALACGLLRAATTEPPERGPPARAEQPAAPRQGAVVEGPWPTEDGAWLDVRLPEERTSVRVHVAGAAPQLAIGDRVSFRAALRPRRAPGDRGSRAGGRDTPSWLAGVPSRRAIVRVAGPTPTAVERLRRARDRLALRIREHAGARAGGVLAALGLGARRLVPPDERERLAATGTAHALAVSGLHLGLVALWLHAALRWLLSRSERLLLRTRLDRVVAALTLCGLVAFTLWTGAEVATVRALVMVAIFLGGRLVDRRTDGPTALAVATIALLTADPGIVWQVSFQLSVAAVTAILWAAPVGTRLVARIQPGVNAGPLLGRAGRALASGLWVSVAAAAGTTPVLAAHFHRVAPLSVLANLVAVPVLALVVLPLALAGCLLVALLPAAWAPAVLVAPAAAVTAWLDAIDLLATVAPDPAVSGDPWRVTAFALGAAILLRSPLVRRGRLAAIAGAAAFLAPLVVGPAGPGAADGFVATVLDVGHGAATVLELPGGVTWLVDGGGRADGRAGPGRTRVLPALRARGVRRIEVLVVSHGHADHAAGLVAVATALPVVELWTPGPPRTVAARRLERIVRSRGGRVLRVSSATAPRRYGAVPVTVMWPPPAGRGPPPDEGDPENQRSVVLRVGAPARGLLLPGDIEAEAEAAIAATGVRLQAAALLAPHHGSATSSSARFVAAVRTRVVVWSRGASRRLRLPSRVVARRYEATGAYAFDTAEDGPITLRFDGDGMVVCGSAGGLSPAATPRCYAMSFAPEE